MRPPRPPRDAQLAADLADLRITMTELGERQRHGCMTTDLIQRQMRLEQSIADRSRSLPPRAGFGPRPPITVDELSARLGGAALVHYIELDDLLYAVSVAGGTARFHALGPMAAVADGLKHLSFALRRLCDAQLTRGRLTGPTAVLDGVGAKFDRFLMDPVADHIGDRPLVIVPTGPLRSLPWSALPSCLGRPITVTPSANLWFAATEQPLAPPPARFVVVAGPGLSGAAEEAAAIARSDPRWTKLVAADATASALSAAMDGAAIVHIAAHGQLRSDNPFFSALLMADGPMTVYDLEQLNLAPRHVILAACDTARPHVIAGDQVIGLAAALLAQGTVSLVAPLLPVPDLETVPLMREYHGQLAIGRTPAEALSSAQEKAAVAQGVERATATAFVCMGNGLSPAFDVARPASVDRDAIAA